MIRFDISQYYRHAPWAARLHVAGRWQLFPFQALAEHIPSQGTFLDIGCGYGLCTFFLAYCAPQAQVWGVDPDREKIAVARAAADEQKNPNVHFEIGYAQRLDLPSCDLAILVDVLYLIPWQEQEQVLAEAANRLQPGGRLLVKEMSRRPRWKYTWNLFEEWLAVRLLHITYGQRFYFRSEDDWQKLLQSFGLRVSALRLDEGYLHPHILFIGEKP
jgi:SAM-dependent methyltransferase